MSTDNEAGVAVEPDVARMRVFLSYSRKDGEFVAKLAEALNGPKFEASYDASPHAGKNPELGIAAEDEWWKQLERMIAAADAMVFIVSPDSIASKVCDEEIVYARGLGKRVIAVMRREIDFAKAPPRLAALNVKLRFIDDSEAAFAASLAALTEALELDAAWWREQSWLAGQVKTWRDADEDKRKDWLLSAAELERAERWAARRPPKASQLSEAERDFLAASREHQAELAAGELRKLKVRQRLQLGVLALTVVALAVTLAGAWFVAQGQRDLARRGSAAMAAAAAAEFDAGQYDRALRLAILAGRETWLTPVASEAAFEIGRAAEFSRAVLRLPGGMDRSCTALSDDGRTLATVESGQLVVLEQGAGGTWTRSTLGKAASRIDPDSKLTMAARTCGAFSPDGVRFAGLGAKGEMVMWRRDGAGWVQTFSAPGQDGWVWGMRFAAPGLVLSWGEIGLTLWREHDGTWTPEHMARPDRTPEANGPVPIEKLDLSTPQPGVRLDLSGPLQAVLDADVSADGMRVAMAFADRMGSGVEVFSRGADGAWSGVILDGVQRYPDAVQVSPQGRRVLVVGESVARVFEADATAAWRMIVQEGQPGSSYFTGGAGGFARMEPERTAGSSVQWPVNGARLLSIEGDGDRLALAGPGHAARMRIGVEPSTGEMATFFETDTALPEGDVETMGARADGTGAHVVMLDRVIAIDDDWRGAGSSVKPEDLGVMKTVSGDGRTVSMMERDGALIVWRIGDPPLGLTESLTASVRAGVTPDPATYSPTTAGAAVFGRSADEVIVVEQEAADEVIAFYRRGKDGRWTREEVAREDFAAGRAEMSAEGLIVTGSGGEVKVHAPKAGGGWSSVTLEGGAWLGARAWSLDGSLLLTITEDQTFEVWARNAAGAWARTGGGGETGDATKAVFLGADNAVATLGDRGLKVWRQDKSGAWAGTVVDDGLSIVYDQMVAARDGGRIAAGGPDGVRVWTPQADGTWKSIGVSPRSARVALDDSMSLSSDGRLLALSDSGALGYVPALWSERQDGQWVSTPVTAEGIMNPTIQISPEGSRLLTTGWEGVLVGKLDWLSGERAPALAQRACAEKLPGGAGSTLRIITRGDVDAAPILQGREGEDVCAWTPGWYDGVLGTVFGWMK